MINQGGNKKDPKNIGSGSDAFLINPGPHTLNPQRGINPKLIIKDEESILNNSKPIAKSNEDSWRSIKKDNVNKKILKPSDLLKQLIIENNKFLHKSNKEIPGAPFNEQPSFQQALRINFIRKIHIVLTLQIGFVFLSFLLLLIEPFNQVFIDYPLITFISWGLIALVLLIMIFLQRVTKQLLFAIILLIIGTLNESYCVLSLSVKIDIVIMIIFMSFITGICLTVTILSFCHQTYYYFWVGFILCFIIIGIPSGFLMWHLNDKWLPILFCSIAAILVSIYINVNTRLNLDKIGEKPQKKPNEQLNVIQEDNEEAGTAYQGNERKKESKIEEDQSEVVIVKKYERNDYIIAGMNYYIDIVNMIAQLIIFIEGNNRKVII